MVEVEVLKSNFKDKEIFNKETKITRNGKEIVILNKLLQVGDIYKVSHKRYKELSDLRLVKKVVKQNSKDE